MKPHETMLQHRISRRAMLALGLAFCGGCASPLMRGQTPEAPVEEFDPTRLNYVGDYTRPWGLNYVKLESVALVTNLANTGSDPAPSSQRQVLIGEMQSHDVKGADQILASPSTSLVLCRTFIPPGAQKGDTLDVEIRLPQRSETTSLRGGWLMQSRMRQMAALGGTIQTGQVEGLAQGDVVVDAIFQGTSDKVLETRGRILGGGVSLLDRKLGLSVRKEESSIRTSTLIGAAINQRFHTFDRGVKNGVAKPQRDDFLELAISSRYKHNLARYLRVVRKIAVKESPIERVARIGQLEGKLLEHKTSADASLELEAIGKEAIPSLLKGLKSSDREVKFYSAEALAYLDHADAAEVLGQYAKTEHAFRWHALSALTSMDQISALDALTDLLHESSAETRYGAFRAIRKRSPSDLTTKGEVLEKKFFYHAIHTLGQPMVHITRTTKPEVVLFGHDQKLKSPEALFAGKQIMVKGIEADQMKVICYAPGQEDRVEIVSSELDKVIRAIVKLGGSYGDVIQFLQEAKKGGYLDSRLAVEAIADPGRTYVRNAEGEEIPATTGEEASAEGSGDSSQPLTTDFPGDSSESTGGSVSDDDTSAEGAFPARKVQTPSGEVFGSGPTLTPSESEKPRELTETYVDPEFQERPSGGFLDKLNPWSKSSEE
ncbi:flagellar P-ring protein [Pirellula staleyi DSM 6068]|uniref:Flagellar P-ring protein n=1 Tax=Pirellula staleyi (strain ATCC 27377 / DSM 6068 / ICPB 4128) TaxID=530564 RepID=D2QWA9_PIRSD|nr:flagellar P-ring protein [Pirellula staleyi DSM 6068]